MNNLNLEKLKRLQSEIDILRQELTISSPGAVLFQSRNWDDSLILVKADGFGGATTSIVEGNYPIDYFTKFEQSFATELEAEQAAEKLSAGKSLAGEIHSEPD
jgi:hypothetical protein